MEISLTKHGYQGQIKGCINGIPFCFYANADTAKSVRHQLIYHVGLLRAYARLAAQGLIMSQQQQQTTTARYAGVSGKTRKQRDLEIKNHVKQTEKELGGK